MLVIKTEWREEEHPRDERGRFTEKPDAPEQARAPESSSGFFAGKELFQKEVTAEWEKRLGATDAEARVRLGNNAAKVSEELRETLERLSQDAPAELVETVSRSIVLSLSDTLGGLDALEIRSDGTGEIAIAARHEGKSVEMRFTLLNADEARSSYMSPPAQDDEDITRVVSDAEFDMMVDQAVTEYARARGVSRIERPEGLDPERLAWVGLGEDAEGRLPLYVVTPNGREPSRLLQFLVENDEGALLEIFDMWREENIASGDWLREVALRDDESVAAALEKIMIHGSPTSIRQSNIAYYIASKISERCDTHWLNILQENWLQPSLEQIEQRLRRSDLLTKEDRRLLKRAKTVVQDLQRAFEAAAGEGADVPTFATLALAHVLAATPYHYSFRGTITPDRRLEEYLSDHYRWSTEETALVMREVWNAFRGDRPADAAMMIRTTAQWRALAENAMRAVTARDLLDDNDRAGIGAAFMATLYPDDVYDELGRYIENRFTVYALAEENVGHADDESEQSRSEETPLPVFSERMMRTVPASMRDDAREDQYTLDEMRANPNQLELYWDWAHVYPGGQGLGSRVMPAVLSSLRQLGIKHVFFNAVSSHSLNGAVTWAAMGADWVDLRERARVLGDFIMTVLEARAATAEELRAVDWSKVRRPYDLLNLEVGGKKLGKQYLAARIPGAAGSVGWYGKVAV